METDALIKLGFGIEATLDLAYKSYKVVWVSAIIRVLPSGTMSQNFGLRKILPCCQLGSTDDRRHFVTLSVHRCVQHN